jgi:hypothetical protein
MEKKNNYTLRQKKNLKSEKVRCIYALSVSFPLISLFFYHGELSLSIESGKPLDI